MTQVPYMLPGARMGYRMGEGKLIDALTHDALIGSLVPGHMGLTAENVAEMLAFPENNAMNWLLLVIHVR